MDKQKHHLYNFHQRNNWSWLKYLSSVIMLLEYIYIIFRAVITYKLAELHLWNKHALVRFIFYWPSGAAMKSLEMLVSLLK